MGGGGGGWRGLRGRVRGGGYIESVARCQKMLSIDYETFSSTRCPGQCLSQDLETGCLKLAVVKFFGVQIFKGDHKYTHISTINIYKFVKIRHDIIKQCHGNYKEMKKFNYKLEIGIFRNSTQKYLGVLRGSF